MDAERGHIAGMLDGTHRNRTTDVPELDLTYLRVSLG